MQKPDDLFRDGVCNPIPASVQIVGGTRKSRSGSIEIWLHFKASRKDMEAILKSESYRGLGSSELNYAAYGPPNWWAPEKLGKGRISLDCETSPHFGRDRSAKDIIINDGKTEAFFLLRSWYNY